MTSKIIVNNLESDAGINTITINSDVTINQIGIGTDNPDHAVHLYDGTLGIGKSENTGFEILIGNNNINFSRDAKSFINQLGTGTISVRLGSSNTEVAEFTSDGLKLPSGKGIDFSATANSSGTMSSELLDDYEEGTFTPAWGDGSAAYSSPVPTYSTQAGHYTKIGNVVHYDVHLVTTAWNSAGTVMWIYGLPFTTRSSLYQQGGGSTFCIEGVDSQDAISNLTTQIAPNKTSIELSYQTPATGANYNTFGTNNVSENNQVNIRVGGFYYTNS